MSRISENSIDQILQTARIEEVIGEFVHLKRAGSNLKGLSPFTDEKTASFVVSPAKQIFKCFSSGKGGTVVSFLMEKEHFSYPEALRWLANKYNIELPEESELSPAEIAASTEKDSLFIINEFAKSHFNKNLFESKEGTSIGLTYFEERGFRKDIIEKFQLGYCLSTGHDLTDHALEKGFKFEYLEKVGLSKEKEGRRFDFFNGRVIFPIHSISGRVLGFGGRTLLTDKKVAKYFNSPDSPVYNKSEILYGLYFAKNDIIKYDECLLCEGYTDVISMHQTGIQNVVSSSGTSLTKEQIKLISRFTKNITILFDGDAAGIKASFRGIDLILEEGLNVKVVLFPEGEDPDSFAKQNTSVQLMNFLSTNKQDFISFKAGVLMKDSQSDPLQKAQVIKEIVNSISLIPDPIIRSVYSQEISHKYNIEESIINQELMKMRRSILSKNYNDPQIEEIVSVPSPVKNPTINTEIEELKFLYEIELMRIILLYGDREILFNDKEVERKSMTVLEVVIQELALDDLEFSLPLCMEIYAEMMDGIVDGIVYTSSYFKKSRKMEIVQFVADLDDIDMELSPNWVHKYNIETKHEEHDISSTVLYAIYNFKFHRINEMIGSIQLSLSNDDLNDTDTLLLLQKQVSFERVKQGFTDKLGRIIVR